MSTVCLTEIDRWATKPSLNTFSICSLVLSHSFLSIDSIDSLVLSHLTNPYQLWLDSLVCSPFLFIVADFICDGRYFSLFFIIFYTFYFADIFSVIKLETLDRYITHISVSPISNKLKRVEILFVEMWNSHIYIFRAQKEKRNEFVHFNGICRWVWSRAKHWKTAENFMRISVGKTQ